MKTRAVKEIQYGRYEWVFCRGLSAYKSGQASIEQDIRSSLLEFENDAFWALQNGIDWVTRLGYPNQKELLDNDIINTIQGRYGVLGIDEFQSVVVDRAYTATCNVYTIFSQSPIPFTFSNSI